MARRPPQHVRKAEAPPAADFDDQLWPVNVAILVLAAFAAGIVIATSDFHDPRILYNGWVRLGSVALVVGILVWAVVWLRDKVRRRVQFCLVLSLLFHLGLGTYLRDQYLAMRAFEETSEAEQLAERPERITVPDYHWDHVQQRPKTPPSFEKPVETLAPDAPEPEVNQREPIEDPPRIEIPQPAQPDTPRPQPPEPAELRRAELSAPRRAQKPPGPQISRQEQKHRLRPDRPIPQPVIRSEDRQASSAPRPRLATLRRRQPEPAYQPQTFLQDPGVRPPQEAITPPRRPGRPEPLPDIAADAARRPQPPRQVAAPEQLAAPRLAEPAPLPAAEAQLAATPQVRTMPMARASAVAVQATVGQAAEPRRPAVINVDQLRSAVARRPLASEPPPPGTQNIPAAGPTALARATGRVDLPSTAAKVEDLAGPAAPERSLPGQIDAVPSATAVARSAIQVPRGRTAAVIGQTGAPLPSNDVTPLRAAARPATLADERPSSRDFGRPGTSTLAKAQTGTYRPVVDIPPQHVRPDSGGGVELAEAGQFDAIAPSDLGGPTRREGGLPVEIASAAGPGGLSNDPSPVLGIPSRRARPESEIVLPASGRFLLPRSGGRLALDGRAGREPVVAFRQRAPDRRADSARRFGGTAGTERAVELGLDFLARHQFPDGSWSLDRLPDAAASEYEDASLGEMNSDTAATGLALLAFLGAGYTHLDDKYLSVVRRGLDWLVANQQPNGQLFTWQTDQTRYAQSYAHGIGAIALSEAYGMTRDPGLREPAQRAIRYIGDAQHAELGGWRYTPQESERSWRKESDTSVSGWQLMALKSAQMAGLDVPGEVLTKVSGWLDMAQVAGGSRYVYNPHAGDTPEQRKGRQPNRAMTAEGLLMRLYLGWGPDQPAMIEGAEYLKANLPEMADDEDLLRDCYYWYYATQVMFQMQDDYWSAWNGRLRPLLVDSQVASGPLAGSWHPTRPVRDRWAHAGGRHYVTAMHLLMLEVYYRHLPLFQTLAE